MCIKINRYLKGYRNKYEVDYCFEEGQILHLFEFDEKEIFHTSETGNSSFYKSDIRNLLEEFKVFENIQDKLNVEKKSFERLIIEAVEDFYEHEFRDKFSRNQYREYLRRKKENEISQDMIYYEEEYGEIFNDEEHFKEWYIKIINYNYNAKCITYNEAKRYHKFEGWKKLRGENKSNSYNLTTEEAELFKEVLNIGFGKLAKKYHPDVNGDSDKMKLLNSLKEKIK